MTTPLGDFPWLHSAFHRVAAVPLEVCLSFTMLNCPTFVSPSNTRKIVFISAWGTNWKALPGPHGPGLGRKCAADTGTDTAHVGAVPGLGPEPAALGAGPSSLLSTRGGRSIPGPVGWLELGPAVLDALAAGPGAPHEAGLLLKMSSNNSSDSCAGTASAGSSTVGFAAGWAPCDSGTDVFCFLDLVLVTSDSSFAGFLPCKL